MLVLNCWQLPLGFGKNGLYVEGDGDAVTGCTCIDGVGPVPGFGFSVGISVGAGVFGQFGTRQQGSFWSVTIMQPAGNCGNLGHLKTKKLKHNFFLIFSLSSSEEGVVSCFQAYF